MEDEDSNSYILEFRGIYESYELALAACMGDGDFIAEVELNASIDFEDLDYYFPYKKDKGGDLPA